MNKLIKLMNQEVANLGVLYTKLHNFHWFVKGPQFFQIHEFFEKLYDEVTELFDEVAERILMLEERPLASLREFLDTATIKEAAGQTTKEEMLKATLDDLVLLNKEFQQGIELAQAQDDEVTADLFIGMQASFQKHIWMLKATLA